MNSKDDIPPYFITMTEPARIAPARSVLHGKKGAVESLQFHTENSVSHIVKAPLRYQVLRTEEDVPDLFCVSSTQVLIVSSRLREAIEPWLKDYELILTPVELSLVEDDDEAIPGGGPVLENYWWLNSWRRLDLVDWEHSDISAVPLNPNSIYPTSPVRAASRWKRLALRAPPPPDEHFFGLTGIMGAQRYLSTPLYAHLKSENLRIKFEPRFLNASAWSSAYALTQELNRNLASHGAHND